MYCGEDNKCHSIKLTCPEGIICVNGRCDPNFERIGVVSTEPKCFSYDPKYDCNVKWMYEFDEPIHTDEIEFYSLDKPITFTKIIVYEKNNPIPSLPIFLNPSNELSGKTVPIDQPFTYYWRIDVYKAISKIEVWGYVKSKEHPRSNGGIRFYFYKIPNYCRDSDRGDDSSQYGEVHTNNGFFKDTCIGRNLEEFYCDYINKELKSKIYKCEKCIDGICILPDKKCKTNTKYSPIESICTEAWPTYEGIWIKDMNPPAKSCNIFEVCSDKIDYIIDDAVNCCTGKRREKTDPCRFAQENSDNDVKRCKGLYIINALGRSATYMKGYFTNELCCASSDDCEDSSLYGKCAAPSNDKTIYINDNAKKLPCTKRQSWKSDTDMQQNTCNFIDLPAHVSLNILETGTCVDYSIALTTLLRKAGYLYSQVMTVSGGSGGPMAHAYNLVKFPRDDKYHVVDTTGNCMTKEGFIRGREMDFKSIPTTGVIKEKFSSNFKHLLKVKMSVTGEIPYDYCGLMEENSCINDNGPVKCPPKSEIYGCDIKKFYLQRCSWDVGIIQGTCDKCWYETVDSYTLKGCCKIKKGIIQDTVCYETKFK